jgi:hypothetical protein
MRRRALSSLLSKILLSVLMVGWLSVSDVLACEVHIKVKGGQKESYQTGDQVVFEVTVFLTHHDCPEGIKATKFDGEGLELLGATKWKEVSTGTYVRLIKAKVTAAEGDAGALHARRKCDKEGGYGFIKLSVPVSGDDSGPGGNP